MARKNKHQMLATRIKEMLTHIQEFLVEVRKFNVVQFHFYEKLLMPGRPLIGRVSFASMTKAHAIGMQHYSPSNEVRESCKKAPENLIKDSSIPYSIIRATFFEFVKSIADFSTEGTKVRLSPVLIQPMAADDVASMVGKIAMGLPLNCIVEVGGPEQFRLDELVRQGLAAYKDSREVIADPSARYYGVELSERTLVPEDNARLSETRFETWLNQLTD